MTLPSPDLGSTPERPLTGATLFLLAGLAALGTLATNIILPAFPEIGADLGVSERDLALTLSSFFIAFAVGQLFVGPLSDRFGRKWLVLGGLATFIAGSLLCALAVSLHTMILGRLIQAIGACAASVLSRAIARDLFEGEALARALALVMVAMAAAPGFSPLVGSALGDLFGWQLIFAGVAVFAAVLAFQYARDVGETNPAAGRVAMPLFAVANAYGRLATDRQFILPALVVALILGCLFTFFATAPAILIGVLGLTGFQLALYFAATVIVVFSAGFLAPRLSHRWGQRAIAMFGALVALSGSLLILVAAGAPGLSSITAGLVLFLFGMGLTNPLGTAIALQPFGSQAGTASALLGFLQMSCAALGTSLATVLPLAPTVSLAAIMTAGSLLAVVAFFPVAFAHPKPSEVV